DRPTEEGGHAAAVTRQRYRTDLALDRGVHHRRARVVRVLVLRLGRADLPAVADDHADVALREDRVLVRLVLGQAALGVLLDQAGPVGQALLGLRAGQVALPLAAVLLGDRATGPVHPRHAGVPVLARHVERGELRVRRVLGLQRAGRGGQLVVRGRGFET